MSAGSSVVSSSGGFLSGSAGQGSARSTNSRNGDLPRQAKEGCEWVWYPEGYWAERQLERRNSAKEPNGSQATQGGQMQSAVNKVFKWTPRGSRSPREQSDPADRSESEQPGPSPLTLPSPSQKGFSQFAPPKNLPSSPYMSEEEQTLSLQHPKQEGGAISGNRDTWTRLNSTTTPIAELISSGSPPSAPPSAPPIRSKTSWGIFQKVKEGESKEEANQGQNMKPTLDSEPSYFTQKPIPPPQQSKPAEEDKNDIDASHTEATPVRKPAPAPRGLRKWLRKLPRPRKRLEAPSPRRIMGSFKERVPDNSSESSSSRSSQIGFTNRPVLTEMASKSTISYPAGEAMHVETPPLKHLTASGKPRSLFMDIKHPVPLEDESSNSPETFSATPRTFSYRRGQTGEKREWWDAPKTTVRRDPAKDVSFFEFDLPEHLPSSPMCPANPKHKGRGTLVCVYHGRGKQMSPDEEADEIEDEEDMDTRLRL